MNDQKNNREKADTLFSSVQFLVLFDLCTTLVTVRVMVTLGAKGIARNKGPRRTED